MMATLNDVKLTALQTLTGETTGTVNDLWRLYLETETSMTATIPDMELAWLDGLGYTAGTRNDRWRAYMIAEGFTGTINDQLYQFWAAGGPSGGGGFSFRFLGGDDTAYDLAAVRFLGAGDTAYTLGAERFLGADDTAYSV